MSAKGPAISLVRPSLFAATWQLSVWLGWTLVVLAVGHVADTSAITAPAFWAIAALVVLGELRPVVTAGGYDDQGIVTSTAFVLAILYLWGPWPAIVLQAAAVVVAELVKRKAPWVLLFNVGQYVLSLAAAWSVMALGGLPGGLLAAQHDLGSADLPWVVGSWAAWYLVNNTLVSGLMADEGMSFVEAFTDDFWFYLVGHFAVMALSPVIVIVLQASPAYLPLLLIPLYAVHKTAEISRKEQHQALHDPLTGLPNRTRLAEVLEERLGPNGGPFALFLLDLDRFKEVNDTLGHHLGDDLLRLVADRLRGALRPGDLVARLGGDEFAVVLPEVAGTADAVAVAERVRSALEAPFRLDDVLLELEASIGVALHPLHGDQAEELLRRADVAMYQAKERRTDVEVYAEAEDPNTTDRLGLLAALRHALDHGELALHYQPLVRLAEDGDGGEQAVAGVEALLRWHHPTRGYVPPDTFIPLAETSGLMHRLTRFVVDTAAAQAAEWHRAGLEVPVSVNVSARDLHGSELARTVAAALARHRLPARSLRLELTERTLMAEHTRVLETLKALEALEVELSLDDFGTGYSSMFMLRRLPVSEIKVDRSFVARLLEAPEDASIVASIIELAHNLGMHAVAEGVETADVWERLRTLGCDRAQGWYVSRPMPAVEATRWLFGATDEAGAGRPLRSVRPA